MNQNPEQLARDRIDALLLQSGWRIQSKDALNLTAGVGVAIREYTTDIGPADYVLFVQGKPVGVIEAKCEEEGLRLTTVDETLTPFDAVVDRNFQRWIFAKQAGPLKYTEEQVQWLRLMKDAIAASLNLDRDDFELDPFNKQGGLGKMWRLFGEETEEKGEHLAA